jgi:hypothetical protein
MLNRTVALIPPRLQRIKPLLTSCGQRLPPILKQESEMSDITIVSGASSAYMQDLQFATAETAAYQAAILQAETIQAAYDQLSANDEAATEAAYASGAENRVEIATAHTAGVEAAAAQAANAQAVANQTAETLASGEIHHHHFHHGQPGPADELSALTQPETPVPPGTTGLDTIA